MRGFRTYPRLFWILLFAAVALAWLFPGTPAFLAIMFSGVALPWLRHLFLNPVAGIDQPYYQWLKTVPYRPGSPLPNGNLMPGFHDAVVLAALCSVFIRYEGPATLQLLFATGLLALVLVMFTVISARLFLNVGPRWIGYFCLCTLVLWLSYPFFRYFEEIAYARAWPIAVLLCPPLIAFAGASVGLKIMMQRFPWGGSGLRYGAIIDNRSLAELTYSHPQLPDLGEPYTSLSPSATWPRLDSVHVYGLSIFVATACFSILSYAPHLDAGAFAFVGLGVAWSRMMTYYKNYIPTVPRLPRAELFIHGNWRRNFAFSLALLIVFTSAGYVILRVTSGYLGVLLSVSGCFFITFAAFRLPPSRKTWETVGFRQIDLRPTVAEPVQPPAKRKFSR